MNTENLPIGQAFGLRLHGTDLVLDGRGGPGDIDTEVIVYTNRDDDNDNQRWIYDGRLIRNVRSGKVLSVNRIAAGELVHISGDTGRNAQNFTYDRLMIFPTDDDTYVLTVFGHKAPSARIVLAERDGSDTQRWEIIY
ncbi:hypothetical protein BGZ80_006155 [Entomortierella chlamydospora]|uniref:Ricin B lectin domain-containing protein n=1 Tax=Entomortierella chlamydospora TaxID=101097 RepID=A0A9P6STT0_9FUNG|nr:hypothetical protein BGZ79_004095 [Entomortierella chlamydospora]KAG0001606.1 hypothetical protein BGZ80_006155 [Entomortierella chlamydospora]